MHSVEMIAGLARASALAKRTNFESEFQQELFLAFPIESIKLLNSVLFFGLDEQDIIKIAKHYFALYAETHA